MALGEHFRASVFMLTPDGSVLVNNYGYLDNNSGSAHIDMGTACGDFQTLIQSDLAAALPDNTKIFKYRFACVFGTHAGEVGFLEVTPNVAGGAASPAAFPNEVCICLKRNTGHTSRTDRGRIFLSPISPSFVSAVDPNQVDTTAAELTALANTLKANLTTSAITLKPIIVDSDGDSTENVIVNVGITPEFRHRKSRRPTVGT